MLRFVRVRRRFGSSVSTLTPVISAAIAVHAFSGTAILPNAIRISLSTALITTASTASVFDFAAVPVASQHCLPHLRVLDALDSNLCLTCCSQVCHVIGLLMVLSKASWLHVQEAAAHKNASPAQERLSSGCNFCRADVWRDSSPSGGTRIARTSKKFEIAFQLAPPTSKSFFFEEDSK